MAQHTPGPWKVWNDRVWTNESLEDMKQICSISGNRGDRDANARLIASAPELLEACKQVLSSSVFQEEGFELPDRLRIHLEQAIAKAEGK